LNDKLMHAEQVLTFASGLPRRGWYRHQIYAPGFYTGYGVKTLPGVREAIEQENWEECQSQVTILATTLQNFDAHLQSILVLN
ncbi:MAG: transferrin receptor-like dimerization domain-containing protein, partial [Cyclobacteriaceae bacterium]